MSQVNRVERITNHGLETLFDRSKSTSGSPQRPPAEPDAESQPSAEAGAELVRSVERFIGRFVVLPPTARLAVALWALATHCFDVFETTGYLALVSPEKGCGKTRTTEVLELIVAEPIRAVSISEAAMFRAIEAKRPTLILDEAEALSGKGERAEAVRSILNAGNRKGASVPRCVGQAHELQMFNVYCPKIVAAIRVLPDTVRDRSLVIPMQRKRPDEKVERFIGRRVRPEAEALQRRVEAWVSENLTAIQEAYAEVDVGFLTDRDAEIAEPLVAILTVSDPSRLPELRGSLEALARGKAESARDESLSLRLLGDIRTVWPEAEPNLFTEIILNRLRGLADAPWDEAPPLNPRKLGDMLRPYGIAPQTVRIGDKTAKGYVRGLLAVLFSRYLPPEASPKTSQPSQPA